jgi:hypothetical protein
MDRRRPAIRAWQPPSVGLTDARAINSSVNAKVSDFTGNVSDLDGVDIRSEVPGLGAAD